MKKLSILLIATLSTAAYASMPGVIYHSPFQNEIDQSSTMPAQVNINTEKISEAITKAFEKASMSINTAKQSVKGKSNSLKGHSMRVTSFAGENPALFATMVIGTMWAIYEINKHIQEKRAERDEYFQRYSTLTNGDTTYTHPSMNNTAGSQSQSSDGKIVLPTPPIVQSGR